MWFTAAPAVRWTESTVESAPQTRLWAANGNEISLTQLVSEGLIVLWLLYYLQSSRYLASLNSFKWCVDSENKPGEQRPGGIQGSDCTASSPPLGSGYNGGLEGTMDGHSKGLELCQRASAPEVSLNAPCWNVTSARAVSLLRGGVDRICFGISVTYGIYLKEICVYVLQGDDSDWKMSPEWTPTAGLWWGGELWCGAFGREKRVEKRRRSELDFVAVFFQCLTWEKGEKKPGLFWVQTVICVGKCGAVLFPPIFFPVDVSQPAEPEFLQVVNSFPLFSLSQGKNIPHFCRAWHNTPTCWHKCVEFQKKCRCL